MMIDLPLRRFCRWSAILVIALGAQVVADEPTTQPVEGLRKHEPAVYALVEARIVVAPGRVIEKGTVVVRDGAIMAVGAQVSPPADAQIVRLAGRTVYPGLIDAFSEIAAPAPASSSGYWSPKIVPQVDAAAAYRADAAVNKSLRSQGITARLVAPEAGLIKGTSALVTSGDEPGRRSLLKSPVALHAKLSVPRVRRQERPTEYPASPMGALALVRQAFYDAQWHLDARRAWEADTRLARPEANDALDALLRQFRLPVIVDAGDELYFLRADRVGREFGLNVVVRGSGNEYRRLDAVAASGRAVIVPVNFPKAPDVSTPEAALGVTLERMMHWDLAPENPARLDRAGVRIAVTSAGLADKSKFLAAVRRAVHRGLSSENALRALTTTPAELFGVANRVGTIDVAKMANFVVTDGDLFAEKTKVLETWVDGRRYEVADASIRDVRGVWELNFRIGENPTTVVKLQLSGQRKLKGHVQVGERRGDVRKATISDGQLAVSFGGDVLGKEGIVRLSVTATVDERGNATCSGGGVWPDGTAFQVTGRRVEQAKEAEDSADEEQDDSDKPRKKPKPPEPKSALFAVNFPLGEFGREAPPAQPAAVLFKDATVWTCGPAGVLERGSVLVRAGRIAAVGAQVELPPGAVVVDCQGKHLTPGIIDCHSHIATDGGINEATQAITAEVRIGDFVDPRDINIYRQLAGGVTSSNILHGSANPIGGQNQVLKFRWGALPEEMKFADAPPGIKFALGENVKQSNWGDRFTTRYPQTRMGVEQIMRDAFLRARSYRRQWTAWQREKTGLPPRVDLELEALAEVVEGKRWVHCHSYRQDEILMLMRLCEEFGIKIGSFQHILEGYKVADVMARHGATGSAFSDWWAYKFEVYDAIPYNGALLFAAGVNVSFNSDDAELGRRLNLEAAKAVKYGRVPPAEALKFVTLNPAKQLRFDHRVGSLEAGKDADLVVWSGSPLSIYTRCEQTWIDGRKFFDRQEDAQARQRDQRMRTALVQRILASGADMLKPGDKDDSKTDEWPRWDEYCRARGGR